MKTNTILSLASFLILGLAGVAHAGDNGAPRRGQVNVQGAAAKPVVAGPAVVHVYSGFSGAKVYTVDATAGADACATGARNAAGTALAADRVETLRLVAGQIACVASTGERSIELLWHAAPNTVAPALIARR